jgi:glycosyltransferase involved in cell wall biosynthesis
MTYTHTIPKISVVIPIHDMKGGAEFLWMTINNLMAQTFQDYEIVIVKQGTMPQNTNAGILKARGELIKILYLDDRLGHPEALADIVHAFDTCKGEWLITSANNNLHPRMTADIETGNNKLGSPSALTIRNRDVPLLFDEKMTWLLDCDYYARMYDLYGDPIILDQNEDKPGIIIEEGDHQVTRQLTDEEKQAEVDYLINKTI